MQKVTPTNALAQDVTELIRRRFSENGMDLVHLDRRDYPEETIFLLRVEPSSLATANNLANAIDAELAEQGFKGLSPSGQTKTTYPIGLAR
jgi:hypothetical protein